MTVQQEPTGTAFCGAVDWGTSRFRLWLLDRDGNAVAERQSDRGMSSLQSAEYEAELETALSGVDAPDGLPVVICGMAGSAKGWIEAPYADLPARPSKIADAAVRVPSSTRDIRMLPGLAQRDPAAPDVMRGEETVLLGLMLGGMTDGLVCMPGTHSKWVRFESGTVTGFNTVMTGELYALLSRQSTLAHAIGDAEAVSADDPAFAAAVAEALAETGRITGTMFSVRAGPLLGLLPPEAAAARLSGLLIGLEVAAAQIRPGTEIALVSEGKLARLYTRALSIAGHRTQNHDSDESVRRGLFSAASAFWPTKDMTS